MSRTSQEERDLENELAAQDVGLIPQLIKDCQELQRDAFTFEGITKALGYRKDV